MTLVACVVVYVSALIFTAACIARAVRYARQPAHLRWELYPVPHEAPERAAHGGSYFEETDWWKKPARFSLWGEMKAMAPEMVLLRGLWAFNRELWYRSFPFHFGLYLAIASIALLLLSIALGAPALDPLCEALGLAGSVLAVLGAGALLHRRLTDPDLKAYTAPADIFNLVFFIAAFGALLAGYGLKGHTSIAGAATAILLCQTDADIPLPLLTGIVLTALLFAYIPLTHMSHFIAKYFTYHAVRWDDRPLARGREMERKIARYLAYRPTWSAPHVGADGAKSWADVATSNPWKEAGK